MELFVEIAVDVSLLLVWLKLAKNSRRFILYCFMVLLCMFHPKYNISELYAFLMLLGLYELTLINKKLSNRR